MTYDCSLSTFGIQRNIHINVRKITSPNILKVFSPAALACANLILTQGTGTAVDFKSKLYSCCNHLQGNHYDLVLVCIKLAVFCCNLL